MIAQRPHVYLRSEGCNGKMREAVEMPRLRRTNDEPLWTMAKDWPRMAAPLAAVWHAGHAQDAARRYQVGMPEGRDPVGTATRTSTPRDRDARVTGTNWTS